MDKQLTAPFKKQLQEQRVGLLAQLASLRGGNVGRAQASADHFGDQTEDSRAQVDTERDLEFALDARESAELDAVDAALKRIEDGIYGVCIDCGADIPAARLHAAPETPRCISCQDKFEHSAITPEARRVPLFPRLIERDPYVHLPRHRLARPFRSPRHPVRPRAHRRAEDQVAQPPQGHRRPYGLAPGYAGRGDSASGHHSPAGGHASHDETYYHSVAEALKGVHEILVTGPAQAKDEFKAHCARHDKDIDKAIVGVISSDHPSDGQLVAMAKQYFLKHDKMNGQA